MSREILLMAEALAGEKNVDKEVVFEALEFALAGAVKKQPGHENMDIRVAIDRISGDYQAFRRWLIVEDEAYTYPDIEKTIEEIQEEIPGTQIQVGEYYEEPVEAAEFGRISAQTAKQVIMQRIRDAEREQILNEFLARQEDIVLGTVKRVERNGVIVEIGRQEALLPRDQMIPRENLRSGDRVRALFLRVERNANGTRPTVILTRTANEFIKKLFELEVPEIEDGLLEIKEAARDPGMRAKIAVKSGDPRLDPQGICIGVGGSRVNAVSRELNGERIDIVLWSPDTAQFIINALSPATVTRILIDEDNHSVDVMVAEDQLAMAIGRGGQNVRLAADLTGWNLNIMTPEEAQARESASDHALIELFTGSLNIDESVAEILVEEGFMALEEVAYVPVEEMLEIEEFDEALVGQLRSRAREAIEEQAAKNAAIIASADENLKNLAGLDETMLLDLLAAGITTRDDLAELSTDELIEIAGVDGETARQVIMAARAHWFTEDEDAEK